MSNGNDGKTGDDGAELSATICYACPQCGEVTETLHEGYCEPCRDERQRQLDEHNASFDRWETLTEDERQQEIHRSVHSA